MLVGDGWAFVHIPKCGGSSVRAVLSGTEVAEILPMASSSTVFHKFHWVASGVRAGSFTFVRHPAAWLRSYWSERSKEPRSDSRALDRLWSDDPSEFLMNVARQEPGYVGRMFDAYAAHAEVVHRLEDGIDAVLSRILGRQITAPRINRGKCPPVSNTALEAVAESEGETLARYGYA